jgi:hypothetical protein
MTTRQRLDGTSTEFGLWLRKQKSLDQKYGYLATNLDYIWGNYNQLKWMMIEEKRWKAPLRQAQRDLIEVLDQSCKQDPMYEGFHLLQFERTSPEDGRIWWDEKEITKEELLQLLSFRVSL